MRWCVALLAGLVVHAAGAAEGPSLRLSAPRLIWDRTARTVRAEGGVQLLLGTARLRAPRLEIDLGSRALSAVAPRLRLSDARGRLRLEVRAARLEGVWHGRGRGLERARLHLDSVWATPCACAEGPPSWSVSAQAADVELGEGAWLYWPVLRILDVPVLPLPILYVPVGRRRSGLLAPEIRLAGQSGPGLGLPLYLVFGPSWDLTLTPRWSLGSTPLGPGGEPLRPGVAGPALAVELRYAPSRHTSGRFSLEGLWDLAEGGRGLRMAASGRHRSRFGPGGFAADLSLLSDPALLGDRSPELASRQRGYVRSTSRLYAGSPGLGAAELAGIFLQDTRRLDAFAPTLQRLPRLEAQILPQALLPQVHLAGALRAEHLSPVVAPFVDRGGDGRLDPEDAAPVVELGATAEVTGSFHAGRWASGRWRLGARADQWRFRAVGGGAARTAQRLYPLAEVDIGSEAYRFYGRWLHRIRPWLRWRLVPMTFEQGIVARHTAVDRAVGDGVHQLVWGVDSLLEAEQESSGLHALRLELAHGYDLGRGRAGELRVRLESQGAPVAVDAEAAWDPVRAAATLGRLGASVQGAHGAALRLRWVYVAPSGSAWMRAGLDEWMAAGALPPPLLAAAGVPIHEAVLSVHLPAWRGLWLDYALSAELSGAPGARPPQHRLAVAYDSPCRCWQARASVLFPPGQATPEVRFSLRLGEMGATHAR
ncbi:MAG: LPS-assembly protein LptD [Deltaproteobacteria bacterium]|nr:MAG: LPS-assembly protein LptD [Deltaproteobacteria bacterium]